MNKINMKPVKSSNIKAVGYDELKMILRVQFYSGGTYEYKDVPRKIWMDFITSKSLGKYFYKKIRDKYKTTKI